jgi:uncharacterized protein (TIGR00297 family)
VTRENVAPESVNRKNLPWQSKLVLLLVVPFAGTHVLLECIWWLTHSPAVMIWTLGVSLVLGLVTWRVRAATPVAAATGAAIMASLIFSTLTFPYEPQHTALIPTLAVTALAFIATRAGRRKKEQIGTAEARRGRSASQVAANLGIAALACMPPVQSWLVDAGFVPSIVPQSVFVLGLTALAEAAADTVSSEIGQVLGGQPRMITTLRSAQPGTDGAISIAGTLAGILAAGIVSALGTWALHGDLSLFKLSCAGAVFGLLFDSFLGATLESRGWLNNDLVNFLSTAGAAGFALAMMALLPHHGIE